MLTVMWMYDRAPLGCFNVLTTTLHPLFMAGGARCGGRRRPDTAFWSYIVRTGGHPMMTEPVGVILAGGKATRMGGGDKGLLSLGSASILGHVIDRLAPQVTALALNANGNPKRFAAFGLPVLPDASDDFAGPLAGVLAGMDWAAGQGAECLVTAAADTPFFPCDLVPRLHLAAQEQSRPIILARTANGRHPTFGLWPVALRADLRQALSNGVRKVVAWTDRHGTGHADFPTGPIDPFFNVNTPDDLERARDLI